MKHECPCFILAEKFSQHRGILLCLCVSYSHVHANEIYEAKRIACAFFWSAQCDGSDVEKFMGSGNDCFSCDKFDDGAG